MNIKTYPLQFTAEKLDEISAKAKEENKSIKQFILDLIETALKSEK